MGTTRWATRQWSALVVIGLFAAGCSGGRDHTASGDSGPGNTAGLAPAAASPESTAPAAPRWTTGDTDELFDPSVLHTFEINLPAENLAELDANPGAEEYVEGGLTFDGETIEPIGVRYKGSVGGFIGCTDGDNPFDKAGPKTCTKLSMKLKINWDGSDAEFFGVRTVLLHSMNHDTTMLHERLGYHLLREMGVPAPRASHARVIVNGEYVGLFALVEDVDGRFTRANFDDGTGNLYKEVWPFDAEGNPTAPDVLLAGLETNEDDDPATTIISTFATELAAAANPEDALEVMQRWTDVDLLLRTLVVDRAIKNDDGPLHWYCIPICAPHNFFWYEEPTEQQLYLIPWDLDNAFDSWQPTSPEGQFVVIADPWDATSHDCQPFAFGLMGLLQRSAACDTLVAALVPLASEFDAQWQAFVEGPFAEQEVTALIDEWTAQIEPAVAEAAAAHADAPTVADWKAAIAEMQESLTIARTSGGR